MKTRIDIILPIILAALLPVLRIFANVETALVENHSPFLIWLSSALILYFSWYFIWLLWDFKENRKRWYAVGMLCLTLLSILLHYSLIEFIPEGSFTRVILPLVLFVSIQYALKSQQNISRLNLEKEQLQTESYKSQLKALRTQIDPHFLFNSLNTLRSMIRQDHASSEKFVLSLSDFYRQTLTHNDHPTIRLSKELEVLEAYLFLMKNRNEKAVNFQLHIDESLLEKQIPTLALQIIIENCFKHNSMTSQHPLQIDITNNDDETIKVCNNIQPKIVTDHITGMGLDLLRKRYELLNVKEGLMVGKSMDLFCVKLKLL